MEKLSKNGQTALETTDPSNLSSKVALLLDASKSDSTRRAYAMDWQRFVSWTDQMGYNCLPANPETVALFLAAMNETSKKPSTIIRAATVISQAHKLADMESPTNSPIVKGVLKGIRRTRGVATKKARPITIDELRKINDSFLPYMKDKRNKSLILLGWCAALRRSEIVQINVDDIEFVESGMVLTVRKSKTDQEAKGQKIGIPYGKYPEFCPVNATKKWIELNRIENGPLYFGLGNGNARLWYTHIGDRQRLNARTVNSILIDCARNAGLSLKDISGHSLRSGFITAAASAGVPEYKIQLHSRHRSVAVLRGYIRESSLFQENILSVLI